MPPSARRLVARTDSGLGELMGKSADRGRTQTTRKQRGPLAYDSRNGPHVQEESTAMQDQTPAEQSTSDTLAAEFIALLASPA